MMSLSYQELRIIWNLEHFNINSKNIWTTVASKMYTSFATRCIEAGVDAKTLSEILGHSSPTITIKKYVHSSMDMKRKNLERLDGLNFL